MVQLQIENDFLITSFSILEQQPMDVLLGLDMLKRHQVNLNRYNLSECHKVFSILKIIQCN